MRFAAWLDGTTTEGDTELIGIHVLEEAHLQAALRYHHLDEVEEKAREATDKAVADSGAHLDQRHIVQGVLASRSLQIAQQYHQAGGTIVGRLAPREGRRLERLGRTARRILRELPGPVIVVPPDYTPPAADAPVVVLTNLRQDAATAMHFGCEFAKLTGRKVVALHVIMHSDDYASAYIPAEERAKMAAQDLKDAKLGLKKWLTGLGLHADTEAILSGPIADTAIDFANEVGAALIVTGSRRMTMAERVLLTSMGSELAAHAPCPVAVVPPMQADLLP